MTLSILILTDFLYKMTFCFRNVPSKFMKYADYCLYIIFLGNCFSSL